MVSRETASSNAGSAGSALLGALVMGSPPAALAVAAITGLGLARGVPAVLALVCGVTLALLPMLGIRALIGRGLGRSALASWLWACLLLGALPFYFPGERGPATAEGLRLLAAPMGGNVAEGVADAGSLLVAVLGRDRAPAATRKSLVSGPEGGRPAAARSTRPRQSASQGHAGEQDEHVVMLPYEGDELSLRVRVDVDGPQFGEQFEMIFDTGATYTTLSRAAVDALGVEIRSDAPWVTLRTANGEIEAPLALIDAFWLGDAVVEWVTVAVCDGCANAPAAGLLGLNVSRQFRVSLDHDRRRIELHARRRVTDRSLDVIQWLEIESRAAHRWSGAVELELKGRNRARQPIESAVVNVECDGDAFAIQLDDIPAHGEATTRLSLPSGTDCSQRSRVGVARGQWRLDRF